MTQCWEEIREIAGTRDPWLDAKAVIGETRVTLGPQASQQWLDAPEHLALVLARYRAAAALIGGARCVVELGCGEGIGAGILARGRRYYCGLDNDGAALRIARERRTHSIGFADLDILSPFADLDILSPSWPAGTPYDAVVSLDVIEHIPADREDDFMLAATSQLANHGVCVIGTPSKHAEHLASPQSRAGHVNLYTPERLAALMARRFRVAQMLYMQDTSLHLGHPGMAHYLLAVGICPR